MFGGRFGINCSGNFKISKYHEGDLCQKSQQTSKHFVMKLVLTAVNYKSAYKTADNYKRTSLTVQCRLQAIV